MIYELVSGLHIGSTAADRRFLSALSIQGSCLPPENSRNSASYLHLSTNYSGISIAQFARKGDIHRGNNRDKCCTKLFATENRLANPHILANLLEPSIRHYIRCNFRAILAPSGVCQITAHP